MGVGGSAAGAVPTANAQIHLGTGHAWGITRRGRWSIACARDRAEREVLRCTSCGGLMKTIKVDGRTGHVEQETLEALVLLQCEGARALAPEAAGVDRQLEGHLSTLVRSAEFDGKLGETLLVHGQGRAKATRVVLVGLGKEKDLRLDSFRQALGAAVKRVRQAKVRAFAVAMPEVLPNHCSPLQ
ncbi:hypothetical protein FBQ96_10285, partial [Nitrospirales bacterium NOB]|nr:hypothetical protein [Nitrospirales bacterium NOB]